MLLGIDIGTTGTKVTLHTLDGRVVGQGYSEYEVNYLQPQWAEQDPKSWIVAIKRSISQTFKQFKKGEESLTGICVSGQSPTLVAVDAKGEPVHPAMIWLDNRAKKEYQEVIAKNSLESLYGLMGIRLSPSTVFPKILWLKKHRKEASVHRVKVPKEQFLRRDHSIDLYKARQTVVSEISRVVGEIRDYNGGMISKQNELLCSVKRLLGDMKNSDELLLENFFYSYLIPYIVPLIY